MKIIEYVHQQFGSQVPADLRIDVLAMSNSNQPYTLSFLDSEKFVDQVQQNANLVAVITTEDIAPHLVNKVCLLAEDPRWSFYTLHNTVAQHREKFVSEISPEAIIHPTASIAAFNVRIGKGTQVHAHVTIEEDVEIGEDCHIYANTVIGCEGFEHKRTSKGILSVVHDGKVILGDRVVLGASNTVSKGFAYRHTTIGNDSKFDNLVHVAHCVQIGERCLFPAACMIAGSVTIGNDVWIGPNASISSGLNIADEAFVTIGSTVTRSVQAKQRVTGYFAIEHDLFLNQFKNNLKGS